MLATFKQIWHSFDLSVLNITLPCFQVLEDSKRDRLLFYLPFLPKTTYHTFAISTSRGNLTVSCHLPIRRIIYPVKFITWCILITTPTLLLFPSRITKPLISNLISHPKTPKSRSPTLINMCTLRIIKSKYQLIKILYIFCIMIFSKLVKQTSLLHHLRSPFSIAN